MTDAARSGLSIAASSGGFGEEFGQLPQYDFNNKDFITRQQLTPSDVQSPNQVVDGARLLAQGATAMSFPRETPPYYFSIGINEYKRESWLKVGALDLLQSVVLPLPLKMVDTQNVDWAIDPIGATVGVAWGGIRALNNGTLDNEDASEVARRAALAQVDPLVQRAIGVQGPARAIQAGTGYAVNDFLTVMLKGPTYKNYQFQWKLSPRDKEETDILARMHKTLMNASAPDLYRGSISAFFRYPKIFSLQFKHESADLGFVTYRFKPAVLKTCSFDFTPMNQWVGLRETRGPHTVMVNMEFLELEYWLTGDYR
jgi:hypothetical protein